jgi:NADH-quinone oxidoreductase subunit D
MTTEAEEGRVYTVGGQDWDEVVAAADDAGDRSGLERLIVNMGPQHPSTHGVLRLILTLDGETVTELRPVVGYLHTGIEKNMEFRTCRRCSTRLPTAWRWSGCSASPRPSRTGRASSGS